MPIYTLQHLSGKEAGRELVLRPGTELVIGRSEGADITIEDPKSSRRHCRIFFDEGRHP